LEEVQKDAPLMLIHKAYQHLHCISLGSCYTKFSSPFAMAKRVLTINISDSHQATMNGFKYDLENIFFVKRTAS